VQIVCLAQHHPFDEFSGDWIAASSEAKYHPNGHDADAGSWNEQSCKEPQQQRRFVS
jgi:hypothetical protein